MCLDVGFLLSAEQTPSDGDREQDSGLSRFNFRIQGTVDDVW